LNHIRSHRAEVILVGSLLKGLTKVFNPLAMPIASLGLIPVWGVIRHTGRRSGKRYDTPIALMATRDGFVIPLPWGDKTDWCRNIRAANGGVVRWARHEYTVREPEVVDRAAAAPAFNPVLRRLLPVLGIERFLRVRRADAAERAA
jgi:deazaflavin-dependent oxidoreductase (nitroreductase family)